MLSAENFTRKHILQLQKESGADPAIIERTVYAFGLLEALVIVHMSDIVSCLMHQKQSSVSSD